jgi:hypothetical protein
MRCTSSTITQEPGSSEPAGEHAGIAQVVVVAAFIGRSTDALAAPGPQVLLTPRTPSRKKLRGAGNSLKGIGYHAVILP